MSYVSKNPRFNSQILTDQGTNSVDDPASGSHKIVNRNGLLYMRDSSGNETAIGSAGATGGINYIDNPSAETGTDGWSTYADAAGTTPVDGTGGSANVTLTRTTAAAEILRGDASFELTVPANSQGEGFSYDFTIDKADQNKVLGIWFDVDATDSNYADDDLQVFIYDKDQSQLITPTSPTNGYKIKGNQYRHRVAFAPYDTSSNDYRLIVHVAADNASGYSVRFDNFEVGPGAIMTGFDGIWKRYTEADVTFSNTPAGWASPQAELIPYKTTDGTWRLNFTVQATTNSLTARDFDIDGISSPGGYQACTHSGDATGGYCQFDPTATFVTRSSAALTYVRVAGDVELTSKPTWADFDPIATIYPSTEDLALGKSKTVSLSNSDFTNGGGLTMSGYATGIRVSNGLLLTLNINAAGTGTSSSALIFNLPSDFGSSLTIPSGFYGAGISRIDNGTATSRYPSRLFLRSQGTTGQLEFSENGSTSIDGTLVGDSGTDYDQFSITAFLPIDEFADLGQVPPIGLELASATQYGLVKSASGSSIPILDSGTYTATASNLSNVSVAGLNGNWLRVGNIVTVSVACTTNSVTTGTTSFEITLPVAATFSNAYELSGVFAYDQASEGAVGIVEAQTTTAKITYAALNTGGYTSSIIFTYRIP